MSGVSQITQIRHEGETKRSEFVRSRWRCVVCVRLYSIQQSTEFARYRCPETGISDPDKQLTFTRRFFDEGGVKRITI